MLAHGKAGNGYGLETENGNGNWKWKMEMKIENRNRNVPITGVVLHMHKVVLRKTPHGDCIL